MRQTSKLAKIISIMLCFMMVLSLFPATALAASEEEGKDNTDLATPATPEPQEKPSSDPEIKDGESPANPATLEESDEGSESPLTDVPPAPKEVAVHFHVDGKTAFSVSVEEGTAVKEPGSAPAAPEGMKFDYWYSTDENTPYDFDSLVSVELDLYAKFTEITTDGKDTTDGKKDKGTLDAPSTDKSYGIAAAGGTGGIGDADAPLMTYTFVAKGTVSTQIIADQDTLLEPETPVADPGERFTGWYSEGTLFTAFGLQTVTENGALELTAGYAPALYVFFHNQSGSVVETREADKTGVVSTTGVSTLQLDTLQTLMGWSTTPGGAVDVGDSVTLSGGSMDLYPVVQNALTVTFASNGGTYVSPMLVAPGTTLTEEMVNTHVQQQTGSSVPAKTGYTFNGWSGFHFGHAMNADVTLNAEWTAGSVSYTVVFWQQDVNDTSVYNAVPGSMVTRTASAGATVAPTNEDRKTEYVGFDYNDTKSVSVTVAGDGSSQLNVYFDREEWTVEFYVPNKEYGLFGVFLGYSDKKFTRIANPDGPYGSDIGYWPSASDTEPETFYGFFGWHVGGVGGAEVDHLNQFVNNGSAVFDNNKHVLKLYAKYLLLRHVSYYTVYNYFQDLSDNYTDANRVATQGTYTTISGYGSATVTIDNMRAGFTAVSYWTNTNNKEKSVTPGSTTVDIEAFLVKEDTDTVYVRHQRNSYSLKLYNNGAPLGSPVSVKYEAPLTSYQPAQPARPSNVPSSFVWSGWYTTPEGTDGTQMNWGGKMPAGDLLVFGVWKAPVLSGVAYCSTDGSSTNPHNLGNLAYGKPIGSDVLAAAKAAAIAANPNHSDIFGGWRMKRGGSLVTFSPSILIYENVELYPAWISGTTYTVSYDLNGATSTVPFADTTAYIAGAEAKVLALSADVTAPAGKVFLGWRSGGKLYYPGDILVISASVTLSAQWGAQASTVSITYYGNQGTIIGGTATSYTIPPIPNNTYHTVISNPFERAGFEFAGWTTHADGSGARYQPDDSIRLNANSDAKSLYAQWDAISYTVSLSLKTPGSATNLIGDGSYGYHGTANLSWTPASGYATTKVTDNGVEVTPSGNSYTINDIKIAHNVVVTLEQQIYPLTYTARNITHDQLATPVVWDSSFNVAENPFVFDGFYFLGWTTDAGGTTPEPAYAPGKPITMPNHAFTLYAVWGAQTPVTLTSNGGNVDFDEKEHVVSGFASTESGLQFENISAGATGTAPGEYTAAFTGKDKLVIKRTSDNAVVTDQYDVSYIEGKLTINPLVTYLNSITHEEYNRENVAYGTGDASYAINPPTNLTDSTGNRYYWDGTYDVMPGSAAASDLKANLVITANYTPVKTLVIKAKSPTVDYTGIEQSVTEAEAFDPGLLVTGYSVSGKGTDVGKYDVNVTLGDVHIIEGGSDITYQYDVVAVQGKLTIAPAEMNVSATGYTGPYDGTGHKITVTVNKPLGSAETKIAYSDSPHGTPDGYRLSASPVITNVSQSKTIYFVVTSPNYKPYYGSADVTIAAIPITIKAQDKSWVYNGSEHSWARYTITSGAFVGKQGIASVSYDPASVVTNVGPAVPNTITGYRLKTNTKPENYAITTEAGLLTITPSSRLRVIASTLNIAYDGKPHSIGLSATDMAGTEFYYSKTGGTDLSTYTKGEYVGTNVADSAMVYVAAVNPNYVTAFGRARLNITRRQIKLVSDTADKVYDGVALTAPGVTQVGDFATGEGFVSAPRAVTSITDFGSVSNRYTRPALSPLTNVQNYKFTLEYGTLTVNARIALLVADDAVKNFGDPDPAFTFHTYAGMFGGMMYYDVLPGDVSKMNVAVYRGDITVADAEAPGVHTTLVPVVDVGSILISDNYGSNVVLGSLTINPQITYLAGTTDAVTGMPAKQWTPYDKAATLSTGATATRTGYKLAGWLDAKTSTAYALGATIPNQKNNLELTAQWAPNVNTVSFQTGTGAAVARMPANVPAAAYLSTVTLPAAAPTRAGFTFDGWQTSDVDGVARVYGTGANFTMPNRPVTLTAAWAANLYSVTYLSNFNGGGSFVDGTHATLSTVTVAGNNFTRRGYRFLGWSESPAGAATTQPGSTFVMPAAEVRYYAQWQQLEYDVEYYVTGGNTAKLNGTSPYATYTGLHYGDPMPKPNDPALNGYTFNGWTGLPATVPEGGLRVNGSLVLQSQVAPLTERVEDPATPLAGKGGIPLWLILAGAGLLGLGLLWLLLLLAKRRKEEAQQGVK